MNASRSVLVIIPTYNEAENIALLHKALAALQLGVDFLFIDDHSPDGTGAVIDRLAADAASVFALHRPRKLGVGSAHQDGLAWAYARGYRDVLTMDADFTHAPAKVREFLAVRHEADVVVGSRFKRPGSLADWVWYRRLLTYLAHSMTRLLLGMPYDASGAFRTYRLDRIPRQLFSLVRESGYSFFWQSLYILQSNGCTVLEIPIDLPARTYGTSKMRWTDVVGAMVALLGMSLRRVFWRHSIMLQPEQSPAAGMHRSNSPEEWDQYWGAKAGKRRAGWYDIIARFYRLYIIKPNLKFHIEKNFAPGARLLHAGCGGGEVDEFIVSRARVTALDISENALRNYRRLHGDRAETLLGSIYAIASSPESYDGVYNLGVMEHFSEEQIDQVLHEFHRVLKSGGRLVLFWPPVYGLSVIGLRMVHFVLNRILHKHIRLHPDEPSLIHSRAQAERYLARNGLRLLEYAFGPRDMFTHAVVVGEKTPAGQLAQARPSRPA